MGERLLKPAETARILATTEKTLAVWRCQGKGPKVTRIGRSCRYKLSDVESFIEHLDAA